LKQCQQCKDIMKSQCTNKKCKEGGIKPVMIPVYYDVNKKSRRKNIHSDKPSYSRQSESESESFDEEDMYFETYYLS
jgi:hypothetical protein